MGNRKEKWAEAFGGRAIEESDTTRRFINDPCRHILWWWTRLGFGIQSPAAAATTESNDAHSGLPYETQLSHLSHCVLSLPTGAVPAAADTVTGTAKRGATLSSDRYRSTRGRPVSCEFG